jgi:dihydrofolate reductase
MIRAILAHDAYWGIGKNGQLPWPKNSDDLAWFKECTTGGVIVMGRKTWESLPKKPLPDRENIVISSSTVEGVDISISGDPISALDYIKEMFDDTDIWIIGGAQLLEGCLPVIEELWFNDVGGDYNCDTFLPKQEIARQFHMCSVEVLSFGIVTKWTRRKNAAIS